MTRAGDAFEPFLALYTIYERPADHPDHFVVRRWTVCRGVPDPVADPVAMLFDTLEAARASIPGYASCIPRQPGDEPQIVETWV